MDTENEIRKAVLNLVLEHDRLKAECSSLHKTFRAAAQKDVSLGLLWRGVEGIRQRELEIAEQESAEIRSVLNSNQQFADLLRHYAGYVEES